RSSASSLRSALVSRLLLPLSSASAWAIQLRRHDSEICNSLASWAIGLSPVRASATARCRNSTGCGAGIDDILPASRRPPHPRCPGNGGKLIWDRPRSWMEGTVAVAAIVAQVGSAGVERRADFDRLVEF